MEALRKQSALLREHCEDLLATSHRLRKMTRELNEHRTTELRRSRSLLDVLAQHGRDAT